MNSGVDGTALKEAFVNVSTKDGEMECFVAYPEQGGPFPPVILYMDAPGVREELYNFVRRIAAQGYFAVIPNLYYRFGLRDPGGRMMEMLDLHTNGMIISDTESLIGWIDGQTQSKAGPMGCIGYCMSGKFVLAVTGAYPERFKAMLSLYGVSHVTKKADSAHLLIPKILPDCTLYFGFAEHDPYVPDQEIAVLSEALAEHNADCVVEKIPETGHGFAFPERMGYHHEAAERHWDIAFELFDRKLR
jgi:carboxymethylenebutenolidase